MFSTLLTFNTTPCANGHEITLQKNKKIRYYKTFNNTMFTVRSGASRRHNCGGKRHNNVTFYSFLKVYTLMCIILTVVSHLFLVNIHGPGAWLILALWINRVPRKYDFKLGTYTRSNGARSVKSGWWLARWNHYTSIYSNMLLSYVLGSLVVQLIR